MGSAPETLSVFSAVVETVLNDGVLTQEEKRLIITIGRELELDDGDPVRVYNAILEGEVITGGRKLTRNERVQVYRRSWRTVNFNDDESIDEAAVMKRLREVLDFSKEEAEGLVKPLRSTSEAPVEDESSISSRFRRMFGR